MKYLVIGSNSFSGANFVSRLLEQELEVLGMSRSPEPHDAMLPYKWKKHSGFTFHRMDLNQNLNEIIDIITKEKPSHIINFAAQSMVAQSWQSPEDWFQTNVIANIKLHDKLRNCDFLERYVHISTPEVYGNCEGNVTETEAYFPSTPYAVSRAACDMSLMSFFKAYQFPVVFTRAANVYGPGQQLYRIIPRTILFGLTGRKLQLHGGGTSVRSFIYMDDVSEGTWRITNSGKNGEIYHLSTKQLISIRDLVEKIANRLNISINDLVEVAEERLGKDPAYILDSTKMKKELDWQYQTELDEGIDRTVEWVESNLETLKNIPLDYVHKK